MMHIEWHFCFFSSLFYAVLVALLIGVAKSDVSLLPKPNKAIESMAGVSDMEGQKQIKNKRQAPAPR